MNLCKNYKTPELEIILIEDDILTGLGVSEVGGGGQPGFELYEDYTKRQELEL